MYHFALSWQVGRIPDGETGGGGLLIASSSILENILEMHDQEVN
jgi:hypothetical protein